MLRVPPSLRSKHVSSMMSVFETASSANSVPLSEHPLKNIINLEPPTLNPRPEPYQGWSGSSTNAEGCALRGRDCPASPEEPPPFDPSAIPEGSLPEESPPSGCPEEPASGCAEDDSEAGSYAAPRDMRPATCFRVYLTECINEI